MSKTTISVVIPTYNAANYLEACLNTLIQQQVEDMEFICVNDGSTDNSLEILKKYAASDNRFKIIDVLNGGYGRAMNLGLAAAKGKYFAILEPDDCLACDAYATLYKIAEEHNLDYAKGINNTIHYNEKGELVEWPTYHFSSPNQVVVPRKYPELFVKLQPTTWCGLYNMEFLKKHNIKYHETPGASYQDTGFFYQTATLAERVMYVNQPVYLYRIDNPNASSSPITRATKLSAMINEYKYVRELLEQNAPKQWEEVKPFYLENCLNAYLWLYYSSTLSTRCECLNRIRLDIIEMENYDISALSSRNKLVYERLLISTEYFLMSELFKEEKIDCVKSSDVARGVMLVLERPKNIRKKILYSVLSNLTFGKLRRKFRDKKVKYKKLLSECRLFLNKM